MPDTHMPSNDSSWIQDALDQHEASLLRYAARLVGDPEKARDLVQETFLELCKAKRQSVEGHLVPWLYRVCRNRATDLYRKDRRVQPLNDSQEESLESPQADPAHLMEQHQGKDALLHLVKSLPDKQQEVVFLRFQAGLSYKEIAEVTGHSVSNVGVLIHTAVRGLRDRIRKNQPVAEALEGAR